MQRARCVRIVYRDSYITSFRRLMKNKLVLAALVLLAIGILLFTVSLQHSDVVDSKLVQTSAVTANNGSYSEVYFGEPANLNSSLTFVIPSNHGVYYEIYGVNNYTVNFHAETSFSFVSKGTAVNGTKVAINSVSVPQGQEYVLKVKSTGNSQVMVHTHVVANIFLVEPSSKNIGGPGVMLAMAGSVILAARVSYVYRQMNAI